MPLITFKNSFPVLFRIFAIILLLFTWTLGGCFGNLQLFSYGQSASISGWHQYINPRPPESSIEEAVINVAKIQKNIKFLDKDIFFIINDFSKEKSVQVVDVVNRTLSDDPYPEKTVTRYRVFNGMISAMSDPLQEFYVDADFERVILRAVSKTWSPERVLIYNNGSSSVTITSFAVNKCTAEIKVYKGNNVMNGTPLATKRVPFCFAR